MSDELDPGATGDPKVFVLQRELSEVHLLMDNLSSKSDCGITRLSKQTLEAAGLDPDWVRQICEIDWPPADAKEAEQAALLIRAKDFLNLQTSPATGMTIAFTLLVTQEDGDGPLPNMVQRPRQGEQGQTEPAPSRSQLARIAYPGLVGKARGFRRWIVRISAFLFIWLMVTCLLSWYVAYGNTVLGQLAEAQKAVATAEERVFASQSAKQKPDDSVMRNGASTQTSAGNSPSSGAAASSVGDYCPVRSGNERPEYQTLIQMQECEARDEARKQVTSIRKTLEAWPKWLPGLNWFLRKTAGTDEALHAASIANVLGTGVLPVFYGILGAGAAIVRLLSRKIRRSTLAPRDLNLALQQLALGAVVGACIGLFVGGGEDGLLGPVALSSTALSFVAGFGVEQVFAAMEALLLRIFGTGQPEGEKARATD